MARITDTVESAKINRFAVDEPGSKPPAQKVKPA